MYVPGHALIDVFHVRRTLYVRGTLLQVVSPRVISRFRMKKKVVCETHSLNPASNWFVRPSLGAPALPRDELVFVSLLSRTLLAITYAKARVKISACAPLHFVRHPLPHLAYPVSVYGSRVVLSFRASFVWRYFPVSCADTSL